MRITSPYKGTQTNSGIGQALTSGTLAGTLLTHCCEGAGTILELVTWVNEAITVKNMRETLKSFTCCLCYIWVTRCLHLLLSKLFLELGSSIPSKNTWAHSLCHFVPHAWGPLNVKQLSHARTHVMYPLLTLRVLTHAIPLDMQGGTSAPGRHIPYHLGRRGSGGRGSTREDWLDLPQVQLLPLQHSQRPTFGT